MATTISFEDFIRDFQIKQIYTGEENGCRCGCHGRYFDQGTVGFTRAKNKAFKLNPSVTVFGPESLPLEVATASTAQCSRSYDDTIEAIAKINEKADSEGIIGWLDISLGNGKTITIYF